jgi:hypothetical protein
MDGSSDWQLCSSGRFEIAVATKISKNVPLMADFEAAFHGRRQNQPYS